MPDPSIHQRPAAPPHEPDRDWQGWSLAWTRHIPTLTGRHDLTVVVAPGAGGGAPACFYPDHRRVEVDAVHIGASNIADPRRAGHKRAVPVAYGLLVHEAGHATHSRWHPPPGTPPVLSTVADLLEESRAEGRQRSRRRYDRQWLRQAAIALLDVDDAPVDDPWHAGRIAALLLARVDARVLSSRDTRRTRAAVTAVIGRRRLRQLRQIWRQAHTTGDTDAQAMIELARRWCHVLDIDPDTQPRIPAADPGEFPGQLAAALADFLAAAAGQTPGDYTAALIGARHGPPTSWHRRDPTPAERHAARTLASRLHRARTRTPEPASQPSPIPPGRLRTRHAITAQAQRDAGMIPTAQPWQRRAATPPVKPTLHLAVLVDTSGSMRAYAAPMSTAAWILAHAARAGHATTTTIGFAGAVTLLASPRQRPAQILQIATSGGTDTFTGAVKLADQLLGLRHRRTLRMLAVVSDGALADPDAAQKLITTLHRAGCVVLWLHPAGLSRRTYDHTTTIEVADPVEAVNLIADAAVTALQRA